MTRISALIPAYNEENIIMDTLRALSKSELLDKLIVIDDGSTDNTCRIVEDLGIPLIKLDRNMGKGRALSKGIESVIDSSDIIAFIDADLGYSAKEIDKLILPVAKNKCDVSIARFQTPTKKGGFGLVKKLAKNGVKYYTGIETDCSLSGQRVFKVEVLKRINQIPSNYGIEVSMIIDIFKHEFKVAEIPVNMVHRETGRDIKGFIHRGKQFKQILFTLIRKAWGV